jgi:uncharacterized protein YkwD
MYSRRAVLAALLPLAPRWTDSAGDEPLAGLAREIFALANRQRRLHGLHVLEWSESLAEQARRHSTNMMESGLFSHIDPDRATPAARLRAAGIRWTRCGENIFREHGMDDPAGTTIEEWMKSPRTGRLFSILFSHTRG